MMEEPERKAARREFGIVQTILCAAGALAGLGLGGYAVVETDNELGTVAVLTLGFLFAVMAMLGRVPRMKFGDTEIDPTAQIAWAALDSADAVADKVAEAVKSTSDPDEIVEAARTASSDVTDRYRDVLWSRLEKSVSGSYHLDDFVRHLASQDAGRDPEWPFRHKQSAARVDISYPVDANAETPDEDDPRA